MGPGGIRHISKGYFTVINFPYMLEDPILSIRVTVCRSVYPVVIGIYVCMYMYELGRKIIKDQLRCELCISVPAAHLLLNDVY